MLPAHHPFGAPAGCQVRAQRVGGPVRRFGAGFPLKRAVFQHCSDRDRGKDWRPSPARVALMQARSWLLPAAASWVGRRLPGWLVQPSGLAPRPGHSRLWLWRGGGVHHHRSYHNNSPTPDNQQRQEPAQADQAGPCQRESLRLPGLGNLSSLHGGARCRRGLGRRVLGCLRRRSGPQWSGLGL